MIDTVWMKTNLATARYFQMTAGDWKQNIVEARKKIDEKLSMELLMVLSSEIRGCRLF